MDHWLKLSSAWVTSFVVHEKYISDAIASEDQLSATQYRILLELAASADGLRVIELSKQLMMSPNTVGVALRRLDSENFVRRTGQPSDGRGVWVEITDAGRTKLDNVNHRIQHAMDVAYSLLDEQQLALVLRDTELVAKKICLAPPNLVFAPHASIHYVAIVVLNQLVSRAVSKWGLSLSEFRILLDLATHESPRTVGCVSRSLVVNPGFVSTTTNSLVRRGLIAKLVGERDKRITHLSLTEAGIERMEMASTDARDLYEEAYEYVDRTHLPEHVRLTSFLTQDATRRYVRVAGLL